MIIKVTVMSDKKNSAEKAVDKSVSENKEKEERLADEKVIAAHEQAEADIEQDPDLSLPGPNDDLDEGETALLGDDKNDLI